MSGRAAAGSGTTRLPGHDDGDNDTSSSLLGSSSSSSLASTPTPTPTTTTMYEPLALRAPPLRFQPPAAATAGSEDGDAVSEVAALPTSTPFYTPSHMPRPNSAISGEGDRLMTPLTHALPLPPLHRTSSSTSSCSSMASYSLASGAPPFGLPPRIPTPNPRDLFSLSPRHSFSSTTGMMHAEVPLALSISASSSRAPSPSPPEGAAAGWMLGPAPAVAAAAAADRSHSHSTRTSMSSSTTSNLSRSLLLGGKGAHDGAAEDEDEEEEDDEPMVDDHDDFLGHGGRGHRLGSGGSSSPSPSTSTPLTARSSGGGGGGARSRATAVAAISSELSRSRRGVQQVLHWMGRRVGFGYGAVSTTLGGVGGAAGQGDAAGGLAPMREVSTSGGGAGGTGASISSKRRRRRRHSRVVAHAYRDSWKDTARSYFVPLHIGSLLNFLCAFALFALGLTFTLKYYLNPDKKALPWRDYCRSPYPDIYSLQFPRDYVRPDLIPPSAYGIQAEGRPTLPHISADHLRPLNASHPMWPYRGLQTPPITAESESIDSIDPVSVFVGVFSVAQASERRMIIRQTYGSHRKSRTPGTEGVKVRFVMGRPPAKYAKSVNLEIEAYNDIILLDIPENMNYGKTHAFFSWAAQNATVDGSGARPDYVVKADDDSFLMLGEIERRLRASPREKVFWGYLVKKTFMAGECYALSRDLVDYVAETPALRKFVRGAEDKVVAKWLRMHPEREQILWVSERCWIYDHPKANTVYSHGFLFPSTVAAIRAGQETSRQASFSTVSSFGSAYRPPSTSMSPMQEIEALVESSPLSRLKEYAGLRPHVPEVELVKQLYSERPKREELYRNNPKEYGGTAVVHFIKRNDWFMETALALLGPHEDLLPAYAASKRSRSISRDKWDI